MRLYDTAKQRVVPFEPGPSVQIYVCGITPYDSTHLGHAATYLTYDLLTRRLLRLALLAACSRLWWNMNVAPALYGNRQARAYLPRAVGRFYDQAASPGRQNLPTARFIAVHPRRHELQPQTPRATAAVDPRRRG